MSRIIIKNLPNKIKEEKLKSIFGKNGQITDCSMKFTKDGRFRKFAFIGFRTEQEAQYAINHFNETFIDSSKITVEVATDLGDSKKPRSWSKYAADSSAYQKKMKALKESETAAAKQDNKLSSKQKKEKKKTAKEKALEDMLGDLKDDPGFEEFMAAHKRTGKKSVWDNDADAVMPQVPKDESSDDEEEEEEEEEDGNMEGDDENDEEDDEDVKVKKTKELKIVEEKEKTATKSDVSDAEYLKSKMASRDLLSDSSSDEDEEDSDDDDDDEDESDEDEDDDSSKDKKKKVNLKADKAKKKEETSKPTSPKKKVNDPSLVVKMKGLQVSCGEKAVKEFFKPLQLTSIRIPRNAKKKPLYGIAYVSFKNEKDLEEAMRNNKSFIGGKRIFLKRCTQVESGAPVQWEDVPRPWEIKAKDEDVEEETVAESGRIFVRNLTYSCTEEDLQKLFEKFGPVSEVHLPIDSLTKKVKGFAIVTYLMPEHAVKAFAELDGTTFMGRLIHLIPAKSRNEDEAKISEGSSYKTKKHEKQKALAGSSHNWNTLFLGANAVADVLAEKYATEKSQILDAEAKQSLGVRMALGETQIVAETRDFLLEEGVALDSFSQPSAARSKTVILVKNLPAGTKSEELRDLFSKHGTVGRVVLPPSGVTAIIEYLEPTEAKSGFRRLAYSKFQHVPLYLEWAPMEVFKAPATVPTNKVDEKQKESSTVPDHTQVEKMDTSEKKEKQQKKTEEDSEEEEEVAELGTTLFVKNLNFASREDDLREKFKKCGKIKSVSVAKKKDMKNLGNYLSMGYGFVEYYEKASADKAIKTLQHTDLDGHTLELKISHRQLGSTETKATKKKAKAAKQKTSKILVRNIPFEAKRKEVFELFKTFGELKSVRLPTKLSGSGTHRGFGFVDFLTKQDAKRAFEALCHSTHLYGRRLVLEWAEAEEDLEELRRKTSQHFHDDSPMNKRVKKSALMDTLEMSHKGS